MAYSNLTNPGNFQLASFGQKGFKRVINGTAAPAGHYNAILVLDDVVLTCASLNGDGLSGVDVPAGVTIVGMFTTVSVTSGTALAYIA
jgi:hypothetical protein